MLPSIDRIDSTNVTDITNDISGLKTKVWWNLYHGFNITAGATRPACDAGWVPGYYQTGLTGKLISPNIYINVALPGSSQHQAGMFNPKNIDAISKDPRADIFRITHYEVIGDYRKVLPAFTVKCAQYLADRERYVRKS